MSTVTVTKDLAQAVFYGVVASALGFAWKQSTRIKATSSVPTGGWKTYEVDGPLFFGSTSTFSNQFDPKSDPNDVIIDFKSSRVVDHSALESINELARKYGDLSKKVHLRGLSSDCYQLLERLNGASTDYELMEPSSEDPIYEVAEDYSKYGTFPCRGRTRRLPLSRRSEVLAVSFLSKRSTGGALRRAACIEGPPSGGEDAQSGRDPATTPGRSVASVCVGWLARAPSCFRQKNVTELPVPPANIHQNIKRPQRKYLRGRPSNLHAPTSGGPQRAQGQPRSARETAAFGSSAAFSFCPQRRARDEPTIRSAAPTAGQNVRPRDDHLLRHVRRHDDDEQRAVLGPGFDYHDAARIGRQRRGIPIASARDAQDAWCDKTSPGGDVQRMTDASASPGHVRAVGSPTPPAGQKKDAQIKQRACSGLGFAIMSLGYAKCGVSKDALDQADHAFPRRLDSDLLPPVRERSTAPPSRPGSGTVRPRHRTRACLRHAIDATRLRRFRPFRSSTTTRHPRFRPQSRSPSTSRSRGWGYTENAKSKTKDQAPQHAARFRRGTHGQDARGRDSRDQRSSRARFRRYRGVSISPADLQIMTVYYIRGPTASDRVRPVPAASSSASRSQRALARNWRWWCRLSWSGTMQK